MQIRYKTYDYTPVLGWSMSRYETFDKCKRMYYYQYYSKYVKQVAGYKIQKLKALTSVPLEIGNVVHDVIEAFLRRLQKDDSSINEKRFYDYAREITEKYFAQKTFLEIYYNQRGSLDMLAVHERIKTCLNSFLNSPIYNWIVMNAIRSKDNWMIEPDGYGETRIAGSKAYCKMDFLIPVDDCIYILDWKTGKKDFYKHSTQLIGYAAAASENFSLPNSKIFPKIVYLYPGFEEFEISLGEKDFDKFFKRVVGDTEEMKELCENAEENIPRPIENFCKNPSKYLCSNCNFQELCFPCGLEQDLRFERK